MPERAAGPLRLGRRTFGSGELLVMAEAVAAEQVRTAVADGADIVTVTAPGTRPEAETAAAAGTVAALVGGAREVAGELVIGVRTARVEVARAACAAGADLLCVLSGDGLELAAVAAAYGVALAGPLGLAPRAMAAGVEPERLMVDVGGVGGSVGAGGSAGASGSAGAGGRGPLAAAVAAGWPVLVRLPDDQGEAGSLATAAVAAWLGARVFCVPAVRGARRALSMVSAIRGDVPPAWAVRGLA